MAQQKITNVLVSGCLGRMGKLIVDLVNQHPNWNVCCGYDQTDGSLGDIKVYDSCSELRADIENGIVERPNMVIDFSKPTGTSNIYFDLALPLKIPMVVATTGLSLGIVADMHQQKIIPIFQASNMSYGIKCFQQQMCSLAVQLGLEDYDIDIEERHHSGKDDVPSGTAIDLAKAIDAALGYKCEILVNSSVKRKENEIRVTSIRSGKIPGTHTVMFQSKKENCDSIECTHTAFSREIFAKGAIKAAEFLLNQEPGFYDMENL